MKKNIHKIAVFLDLKESEINTLKSTLNLAKMINGEVEFFHVKKPTEMIKEESQLSAMKTINDKYFSIEKKIKSFINSVFKDSGIKTNYTVSVGNIESEIIRFIETSHPDIIVLGKRKASPLKFVGDGITQLVLKKFNGIIMIASDKNILDTQEELSLGLFNNGNQILRTSVAEELLEQSQKPLKSFKIANKASNKQVEEAKIVDKKVVEYVFEKNDTVVKSISSYLSKSKVNLLLMDRQWKGSKEFDMKKAINNLDVSLLLSGGVKQELQVN